MENGGSMIWRMSVQGNGGDRVWAPGNGLRTLKGTGGEVVIVASNGAELAETYGYGYYHYHYYYKREGAAARE